MGDKENSLRLNNHGKSYNVQPDGIKLTKKVMIDFFLLIALRLFYLGILDIYSYNPSRLVVLWASMTNEVEPHPPELITPTENEETTGCLRRMECTISRRVPRPLP